MHPRLSFDFWKLLIIIVIFTISGVIFQRKEYFVYSNQLGYLEVNKNTYNGWYNDPDRNDKCKAKNVFNIPVGFILSAITFLAIEFLKETNPFISLKVKLPKPVTLREYSIYYHGKGFNIVPLYGDYEGNNVTQDSFKTPRDDWSRHKVIRQNKTFINSIDWKNSSGIGAITGINNLICLDIDDCKEFEFINILCKSLGLEIRYPWIVRSGSYIGYHIWLKSKSHIPSSFYFFADPVIKFLPKSEYSNKFKQIEVRMCDHVVLPPSINSKGNIYEFYFGLPNQGPSETEIMNIINALSHYAIAE